MTIFEVKKKYANTLDRLLNVVGTGIGSKRTAGAPTGQIAIVVFVKVKVPEAMLQPDEVIPKELEGYVTDVVETGEIILQSDPCCVSKA